MQNGMNHLNRYYSEFVQDVYNCLNDVRKIDENLVNELILTQVPVQAVPAVPQAVPQTVLNEYEQDRVQRIANLKLQAIVLPTSIIKMLITASENNLLVKQYQIDIFNKIVAKYQMLPNKGEQDKYATEVESWLKTLKKDSSKVASPINGITITLDDVNNVVVIYTQITEFDVPKVLYHVRYTVSITKEEHEVYLVFTKDILECIVDTVYGFITEYYDNFECRVFDPDPNTGRSYRYSIEEGYKLPHTSPFYKAFRRQIPNGVIDVCLQNVTVSQETQLQNLFNAIPDHITPLHGTIGNGGCNTRKKRQANKHK
jgi:hypothetical protein